MLVTKREPLVSITQFSIYCKRLNRPKENGIWKLVDKNNILNTKYLQLMILKSTDMNKLNIHTSVYVKISLKRSNFKILL